MSWKFLNINPPVRINAISTNVTNIIFFLLWDVSVCCGNSPLDINFPIRPKIGNITLLFIKANISFNFFNKNSILVSFFSSSESIKSSVLFSSSWWPSLNRSKSLSTSSFTSILSDNSSFSYLSMMSSRLSFSSFLDTFSVVSDGCEISLSVFSFSVLLKIVGSLSFSCRTGIASFSSTFFVCGFISIWASFSSFSSPIFISNNPIVLMSLSFSMESWIISARSSKLEEKANCFNFSIGNISKSSGVANKTRSPLSNSPLAILANVLKGWGFSSLVMFFPISVICSSLKRMVLILPVWLKWSSLFLYAQNVIFKFPIQSTLPCSASLESVEFTLCKLDSKLSMVDFPELELE